MYDLKTVGAGEQAPPPNSLAYRSWNDRAQGWNRYPAQQTLELRQTIARWYVLRPYGRVGGLGNLATALVDEVPVVTGEIHSRRPVSFWRYAAGFGLRKPLTTIGTIAVVPVSAALAAIDVLPQPMGWPPITVSRFPPFTRKKSYAMHRALPSGAPVSELPEPGSAGPRIDRLRPIAADPSAALSMLSPELARLALDEGVAWAVEAGQLYVWTHRWLRGVHRPRLAACAVHISRLLADGGTR